MSRFAALPIALFFAPFIKISADLVKARLYILA